MMIPSKTRHVFYGLVAALAMLAMPSGAHAGTFTVTACSPTTSYVNHAWTTTTSTGGLFTTNDFCASGGSAPSGGVDTTHALNLVSQLAAMPAPAFGYLTLTAPSGTTISQLNYSRHMQVFNDGLWRVQTIADSTELEGCQLTPMQTACFVPSTGRDTTIFSSLSATIIRIGATCATGCNGGAAIPRINVAAGNIKATITDTTAPTANSLTGSLPGGTSLSGAQQVTVSGSDVVGIKAVDVSVDGIVVGSTNNGCDYSYTRPCAQIAPSFSSTFSVDTSALTNGTHTLTGRVYDAANNLTTKTSSFTVYNPPVVVPPPPVTPPPTPAPTPRNSYLRLTSSSVNGKTLKVAGLIHSQASGTITIKLNYRDSKGKAKTKTYTATKSGQKWTINKVFTPKKASMAIKFTGNSPWVSASLVKSLSMKKKKQKK